MLYLNYLSGIIMIIVGCVYKLYPPKHINYSLGYRASFAIKNIDTWNENIYCFTYNFYTIHRNSSKKSV